MRLYAAPTKPKPGASNPLARLDFFDLDGRLVVDDAPPRSLDPVVSTWRASSTYPTGIPTG